MKCKKVLTSVVAISLVAVSAIPTTYAATATTKYIIGDVDLDGKVTSADSLKIQRYIIKKETFNDIQKYLADVNGDGKITNTDSSGVLNYSIGKKNTSNRNAGKVANFVQSLSFTDNKCTDFTFKNGIYKNNQFTFNASAKLYMSTKLTVTPAKPCEDITYSSSDPSLATVDKNGNVTFNTNDVVLSNSSVGKFCKTGTVTITATSSITHKVATCKVEIEDFYDNIAFSFFNKDVADGGYCYGISLMSCLLNSPDSGIKCSDFSHKNGAKVKSLKDLALTDVYKGTIARYKNKTLQDFIIDLQEAQHEDPFPSNVSKTLNDFDGLIKAVKEVENTKKPVLIGIGDQHAIVGYKVVETTVRSCDREATYADKESKSYEGWQVKRLYYYDCNEPKDKNRFISFFVKDGKIVDWRCMVTNIVYCKDDSFLNSKIYRDKPVTADNGGFYNIMLSNGTTQRFKKTVGTDYVDSKIYLPYWETVK